MVITKSSSTYFCFHLKKETISVKLRVQSKLLNDQQSKPFAAKFVLILEHDKLFESCVDKLISWWLCKKKQMCFA